MFIRELKTKRENAIYKYYKLVETFSTPYGPRQRDILILKNFRMPKEEWKLLVSLVKAKLSGQETLIKAKEELQNKAEEIANMVRLKEGKKIITKKETAEIILDGVKNEYHRELGSVYVGISYWDKLGFGEILKECNFSDRYIRLAQVSVLNRLVEPGSELFTSGWYKRVALADLLKENEEINKDSLYRVSDKLIKNKEEIENKLYQKELNLFSLEEGIILYDLTSTYFEGKNKANPKSKYGYSRDKRSDCVQLVVGLVLDNLGFVKMHKIFEGNTSDGKSLIGIVQELDKEFHQEKPKRIVVVDRGISSEENLEALTKAGYTYIVATKQKELSKYLEEYKGAKFETVKFDLKNKNQVSVHLIKKENEQYLVCKSTNKEFRDKDIRIRLYQKIEKGLEKLTKRVKNNKLVDKDKIHEAIGKIKERYPRVAKRYEILIEDKGGKKCILWKKDKSIDTQVEYLDGTYLLRTTQMDLNKEEIWKIYTMLSKVENAFRYLKSHLGIKPIFHHKEFRCDGHIFISILAYHILHAIEYTLKLKGDTRSWPTICDMLSTHQVSTVILPSTTGAVHHIRIASTPEPEHIEIYEKLGLKSNPLSVKRYLAK